MQSATFGNYNSSNEHSVRLGRKNVPKQHVLSKKNSAKQKRKRRGRHWLRQSDVDSGMIKYGKNW